MTGFEKHTELINLFERFGFSCVGKNKRGECVYLKSRLNIDYSNPYRAFPFFTTFSLPQCMHFIACITMQSPFGMIIQHFFILCQSFWDMTSLVTPLDKLVKLY